MLKKIGNIIFYSIFGILAACFLSIMATKFATGKPSIFGFRPILVVSGSMEPTIKTGSIVIASPIDAKDVQIGDIVTYKCKGATIVHRVIEITDDGLFVFKGDHNQNEDDPVDPSQIGYIIKYIPFD